MHIPDPAARPRRTASCMVVLTALACLPAADAATLYRNTFDAPESLNNYTVHGEAFVGYNPPPLHSVSVDAGQLRIDTACQRPGGPGSYPVLSGRAFLSLDASRVFQPGYNTTLSQNSGSISWSFNLSNQDGAFNNDFSCVLASTQADPYTPGTEAALGYAFCGGGMVGNRMVLKRFDYGMGGSGEVMIDVTDGLGLLPNKGSFRITFDPAASLWSLYGETGSAYTDPMEVETLLGTAVDDTHTGADTRYFGLMSSGTGTTYFDNVQVDAVPEPASALCMASAFLAAVFVRRRFCV